MLVEPSSGETLYLENYWSSGEGVRRSFLLLLFLQLVVFHARRREDKQLF